MTSSAISINTRIPGPKSCEIAAKKEQYVPLAFETLAPFFIAEGKGALVKDVDGNQFIDFTGGWGCLIVGHTPNWSAPLKLDTLGPKLIHAIGPT